MDNKLMTAFSNMSQYVEYFTTILDRLLDIQQKMATTQLKAFETASRMVEKVEEIRQAIVQAQEDDAKTNGASETAAKGV